ncbi:Uncharacterised protein [Raoultella planticola]|uniref:Uncharacterized protein n=1 Tax=Raoultella planticola TaxID=575 RepID=A0A485CUR2_RAOPL|nr:Uncharacterised protein [Raoultella planticola]
MTEPIWHVILRYWRSSLQVGEIYTRTSGTMTGAIPSAGDLAGNQ